MRRLVHHIIVATFVSALVATTASSEDLLIVLSLKTSGYNEVLSAMHSVCDKASTKVVNLAENAETNLPQVVQSSRSKVVLAVGDKAYKMAISKIRYTPVLGAMVSEQNTTTVPYIASPERYLATIRKLGRKKVGVFHSSQMSSYVRRAKDLSKQYGITLYPRDVTSPMEVMNQLATLKGQIDVLWIIPDTNILTAASAEIMLGTAQEFNIPVVAFSKNYLDFGAAVVLEPDRGKIGKIIGEGVCKIIDGANNTLPAKDPYREMINSLVFDRLRLPKQNFETLKP